MTEKNKKPKPKKTVQKQKQSQKQSVVVNVNTDTKKTRRRTSKKTGTTTKQAPTSNISFNPVISFPSQEQMYRTVLTQAQNQPPPVLGNANDINASVSSILNSIKQQNIPNKQEALQNVIPKMQVLAEQAHQSIQIDKKIGNEIEAITDKRSQVNKEKEISNNKLYHKNKKRTLHLLFKVYSKDI